MTNNPFFQFLQEIIIRLSKKSPLFFQILQGISLAVIIVPGIPALLDSLHITLSPFLQMIQSKTVAVAGIVGLFMSSLNVDKKLAVVNLKLDQPIIVETVVQKAIDLPFTDNN